jgi:uncharacterized membrane protein YgdD (TMEM256/DUF423 family)
MITANKVTANKVTATKLHLLIAGLFGAIGVALLAAGAHSGGANAGGAANVTLAGQMLLFHAPAIVAATAARRAGLLADRAARLALFVLILGAALFAGDLALRGLAGTRLFAMASPAGGIGLIVGWLGLGLSALPVPRR